jgi:hypothetical protein
MKNLLVILSALISTATYAGKPSLTTHETSSLCGPIPAVCYPTTISGGFGIGIYFVSLNLISNSSSNPPMFEDFTCTDSTWLTPGVAYPFEVHTGTVYEETLKAWIDFSNDGNFDPTELVYQDSAMLYMHQGLITVPVNAIHTFTPIRMRIGSEAPGNVLNGCNDAYYGQYEDYTIYYGIGIGVNDQEKSSRTTIFPNPFHSSARIIPGFHSKCKKLTFKIYNGLGALARDERIINSPSLIIERGSLPDGLYFYELIADNSEILSRGKFIIE